MNILYISLYSPPEKTGIGKYNGELFTYLNQMGHNVSYMTTLPFYPEWRVNENYRKKFFMKEKFDTSTIHRIWSYTPKNVSSIKRIVKEVQFFIHSLFYLLKKRIFGYKPDLIIFIAPPFFLPFLIKNIFKSSKTIYHIQDLEVDAASELNMLPKRLIQFLFNIEQKLLSKIDLISTISEGMVNKVKAKGIDNDIYLFPNWSNISRIYPKKSHWLHDKYDISSEKKLIVYSGNIGRKQGFEILPETIREVCNQRSDVKFIILGEGVSKKELEKDLSTLNPEYYTIGNLVDFENLNDMLNSSFIQLVIQKSEGSDSFMPSKLTNILAAGVPSIVTAKKGTGLYNIIEQNNCAYLVDDNSRDLSKGIIDLLEDDLRRGQIKKKAKFYAEKYLSSDTILSSFEKKINELVKH